MFFPEIWFNLHRTLSFHMRSPLIPLVNKITKQLVEAGIVDKIIDNISDPSGWTQGIRMRKHSSFNFVSLSLFHMISQFVYLICGLILSSFAFVVEVFVKN